MSAASLSGARGVAEDYFHGPHAAARSFLLGRVVLCLLALDAWLLMIRHAGRYGAGGFNVAHFAILDRLQPLPSPALYIGVLVLLGLFALAIALTGMPRGALAALLVLYTYSWAMSMLDSFQHHYFLSLVLVCLPLCAATSATSLHSLAARHASRSKGFGFPLLGVSVALVYTFSALAKLDADWLAGHTMQQIGGAGPLYDLVAELAARIGVAPERLFGVAGFAVIALELALAGCYLVAVVQDRAGGRLVRTLCALGFCAALALHLAIEALPLRIGWFSAYMLVLAAAYLLPLPALARLAGLLVWPARLYARGLERLPLGSPLGSLVTSLLSAAALIGAGALLDLPGALGACAIAALGLAFVALSGLVRGDRELTRRWVAAGLLSSCALALSIELSSVRYDYYRYLGGDLSRRGEAGAALEAYRKAERYAPAGKSRATKIRELQRRLGEAEH